MMLQFRGQCRLRTLLLAVTCFAAVLGYRTNHVRRRAQAIAVIRDAGGGCIPGPERSRFQGWLGWLVSPDAGEPVFHVDLSEAIVSESLLAELTVLAEIERLTMGGGVLPATWPHYVSRLTRLRHLALLDTSLRDLNLDFALFGPQVRVLDLANSHVADVNMHAVGACRSLQVLVLDCTRVSDRGISFLAELPGLTDLYLIETPITNEALKTIGGMKTLRFLNLNRCCISDDGLRYLSGLDRLEGIVLEGTAITDAGLQHLHAMPALSDVYLGESAVTDKGVSRFQLAMPRCRINR